MSPYMTIEEAAEYANCQVSTLRKQIERGRYVKGVHYFNRGGGKGRLLFWRDKFIAKLEGREVVDAMDFAKKRGA